jgi:hypothetical protein
MELHELHRGRLEATVSLIEDGLDRMERLLRESGRNGIVRSVEDHLSPAQRTSLLENVRQLRMELRAFADRFSLQRHPMDLRQVFNAELSSAWVMLEDCRPNRMKGYGVEFSRTGRAELEEYVEKLLARVKTLLTALK